MAGIVENLKGIGFGVRIQHNRYNSLGLLQPRKIMKEHGEVIEPRGGVTRVWVEDKYGNVVNGEAICSRDDVYNKKYGIKLATLRAYNKYKQIKLNCDLAR